MMSCIAAEEHSSDWAAWVHSVCTSAAPAATTVSASGSSEVRHEKVMPSTRVSARKRRSTSSSTAARPAAASAASLRVTPQCYLTFTTWTGRGRTKFPLTPSLEGSNDIHGVCVTGTSETLYPAAVAEIGHRV
eukprot:631481-Rhodomonas_salina.1